MAEKLLEVENLQVSYARAGSGKNSRGKMQKTDNRNVVDGVSFSVEKREMLGLLGRNGCGKTTLLKGMLGAAGSVQGSVRVNGQNLLAMSVRQRARQAAMLAQRVQSMEGISGAEMIEMGFYAQMPPLGRLTQAQKDRVRQAARQFGAEELLEKEYSILSEGQKQLIQLARLAVQDTPVILLDEPDSALDFGNRHMVFQNISQMIQTGQKAGIVVLHDPSFALRYCSRVLLLHNRKIAAEIRPQEEGCGEIEHKLRALYPGIAVGYDAVKGQYYCLMKESF